MAGRLGSSRAPKKILSEIDRSSVIIRDLLNESFNNIHVNDTSLFEELRAFIRTIAPEKADIVKLYKNKVPIFEHFAIDKQIRQSFGKKVDMKNGAYLIIEHTEAMHVIDVNSGHRNNSGVNQESNALEVNLDAASEVARQLRLRDLGGIIVVDFIDMHLGTNRRLLYEKLKLEMSADHSKHTILPPSKFGVVQITRQRVRPQTKMQVLEQCPVCEGTGEIKASIALIDDLENHIRYFLKEQNEQNLRLAVHPYLHAFLTKGFPSLHQRWFLRYKKWIPLTANSSFHLLEYHFFNKKGDEIKF